jgi:ABC-type proline/glycine betaine transport system ATPase subunit
MIAHRLETAITYSDKILVMNQGKVAEYDHSFNLLIENVETFSDFHMSQGRNQVIPTLPTRNTIFASMVKSLPSQQ